MKSQYPGALKAVREWVARQKLGPGSGLPSVRRLSGQLGFTPKTMELACNFLISGGVLKPPLGN